MGRLVSALAVFAMVLLSLPIGARQANAAGSISLAGGTYTQDFNTLASTGTSSTTPTGWAFLETGTNANTLYAAGTGSSNAGDTYSFGSSGSSERAFGGLQSGPLVPTIGASFTNNTGQTLTGVTISYTGEQWRLGATGRGSDRLDFQFSTDATSLSTGTWANADPLDFTGPVSTGTVGLLNGNAAANRVLISGFLGVTVASGATFWIRWSSVDVFGSDDGLAIDDFALTPGGDVAPAVSSIVPQNNATDVARNANVTVTFSEPVDVSPGAIDIACSHSGVHTFSLSGGPSTFTVDPDVDFDIFEACTVSILALGVSDKDVLDPPDTMTANFNSGFTTTTATHCGDARTAIHAVQGNGLASPLLGTTVEVEGVVIASYQGAGGFGGFYVQERDADADADPATSEGLFVFSTLVNVGTGTLVRVSGTVDEFNSLTELNNVSKILVCSASNTVTPTAISLPVNSFNDFERYEGMLVSFAQTLTATDNFTLARFGEVTLAADGRLFTPTAVVAPGAPAIAYEALNERRSFVLDDGNNQQNIDPTNLPAGGLSATNTLRSGYTVTGLTGVFDYRFGTYRLQPIGTVSFAAANPRTAAPDPVGGNTRAGSFNVLNYFNGDGVGGGFPTARGANTVFEFQRQTAKEVSAILALDPDVLGLMEMENDSGPNSAIAQLVSSLNAIAGPGAYAYVDTGMIGGDLIKTAIIYKPAAVTPIGAWKILTEAIDPRFKDHGNRPSLAQTFVRSGTVERFTVVVNHLRSKGSSCDSGTSPFNDPDTGDGQGNCNLTRTNAAAAIVDWLATDPTGSGSSRFLLIGDMNSYAKEDPITRFVTGGYTNLVSLFDGPGAYSYVFGGESGYLDHALASTGLLANVTGVTHWHINSDEPTALDYNVEFKTANQINTFYAPDAYRTSDHDPVVIGLDLHTAPPVFTQAPQNKTFGTGDGATICGRLLTAADLGPIVAKGGATPIVVTASGTPAGNVFPLGSTTITYTATDSLGQTATATQQITVIDDTLPVIKGPGNSAYQLVSEVPSGSASDATAWDNCPDVTVKFSESNNGGAGSPASPLVIVRMWTATDKSGNSAGATQTITVIDDTPPTISGAPTTPPNGNHWWNAPVTVHFTCADNSGNLTCPHDVTLSDDGADQSVSGTATDAAGNSASTTVGDIDIDQTMPTIAFAGATTYTVSQTVNITCTATDALSGVSTALCPGASGPAYSFGVGSHTLSASATDAAGNTSTASYDFTVTDDAASVCTLVRAFVSNAGIANSLCVKLDAAAAARARGNVNAHDNQLQAFMNDVNAQRGKAISDANANILVTLAGGL